MIQRIDHIVIIAADLEVAVAKAKQAGFTVLEGGVLRDGKTHNSLIQFPDGCYIELAAPIDGLEGWVHRWSPRLVKGEGLADYCLLSDDLPGDISRIREQGRKYTDPRSGGRNRPDGVQLKWRNTAPVGNINETEWPFIVEDLTPRDLRVSTDSARITHANGAIGIAGLTVLTPDLRSSVEDFAAITGRDVVHTPSDDRSPSAVINFEQAWIRITQPTSGEALDHLEQVGPGPYTVTLRTHEGPITPGTGKTIPAELLSGASFELV